MTAATVPLLAGHVEEFDFVVVGAGTAGCALLGGLRARLPSARVALVEIGSDVIAQPTVSTPGRWPSSLGQTDLDYGLLSESQQSFGQRQVSYPRGKGLGGSNLLNVMIYSRGFKEDWDKMPEGWRSEDVGPIFEALERKLHLTQVHARRFGQSLAKAAESLGFKSAESSLWAQGGTTTSYPATIDARSGRRLDLWRALGANHQNVTHIRARAEKLLINSDRCCIGVQLSSGRALMVGSGGEVVLCGGAVESPKLLQLSGIGPAELLRLHRIDEIKVLPVGEGLKDHTLLPYPCLGTAKPLPEDLSPNSIQGWIHDEDTGIQFVFVDGKVAPDIAPLGLVAPYRRPGCCSGFLYQIMRCIAWLLGIMLRHCSSLRRQAQRVVAINICLTRPTSTGRVWIKSKDASVPPAVDPQFLSTDEDRRSVRVAISTVRSLFKTAPVCAEISMDLSLGERRDETYARDNNSSYYHPTGTCRMGDVVHSDLRVFGIKGLRVADASVLPVQPRVGPMPACMVIGTRCAELLARAKHT